MAHILVACEFSGIVRDAFLSHGYDAWSCDLLPSERPGPHLQCDISCILQDGWDMLLAFPPCTYLCRSGARWWPDRQQEQAAALTFVQTLLDAPIPHICLENPVGKISSAIRKPDQTIQPWEYGEPYAKRTCLWLKGLPKLIPTKIMSERTQAVWWMGPGKHRSRNRSRTYPGIAQAMATQWSACL